MNKIILLLVCAVFSFVAGCSTPVDVQGDYSTANQTIAAGVDVATNGVSITGSVTNK